MNSVRTRFAPSPTGYLHVGGVRTALFAWLVAKQANGQFILRLEDTDQKREVEGSAEHIIKSLNWLGITWDEGPDVGGEFGPYVQSKRLKSYHEWADKLIKAGRAYADPYSQEQLEQFRAEAIKNKRPFLFRDHRPDKPEKWDCKSPLRFKSDPKSYHWNDLVMGDLSSGPEVIDDFIIIKSDGYPTYNFAHIVDDHLMQISHVIRSQEFLASVPIYLNLYEALGLEPPKLATLPPILAEDGKRKLSKRDNAKDILDYAKLGYLPDAMVNFLASLGWNDGSEQEIFSREELIKKFNLSKVQKSGAHFNEQRLNWIDGHYIRETNINELYKLSTNYWPASASNFDDNYKKNVLSLIQERLKYFDELAGLTEFFFKDLPIDLSLINQNPKLSKVDKNELIKLLRTSVDSLNQSDFTLEDLNKRLNDLLEETGQKPAILFSLIRIATTMAPASPGLADTLNVLGKEVSLKRVNQTIEALSAA